MFVFFFTDNGNCSVLPKASISELCSCDVCGRWYKYKRNLVHHKKYECGKEPQFKCQYCPYKSKVRGNLRSHVFRLHLKEMESAVAEPYG